MNEQVLITLCEKLGTTIDNLIPRVIEFGLLDSKQGLLVGIIIFILGVVCICILKNIRDELSWPFIFFLLGSIIGILVGVLVISLNAYDLSLWHKAPEMMAYKTILHWIGT